MSSKTLSQLRGVLVSPIRSNARCFPPHVHIQKTMLPNFCRHSHSTTFQPRSHIAGDLQKWPQSAFRFEPLCDNSRRVANAETVLALMAPFFAIPSTRKLRKFNSLTYSSSANLLKTGLYRQNSDDASVHWSFFKSCSLSCRKLCACAFI